MTQELRDKWEDEALKIFEAVYSAQLTRTVRALRDADAAELEQVIAQLYQSEPNRVRLQVQKFIDRAMSDVVDSTIAEVPRTLGDTDQLTASIIDLSSAQSVAFSRMMSKTGFELTYSIIEKWRETPGATQADLIARMRRTWKGKRPKAAAVTETTRLYNDTRMRTFQALGVEKFQPRTRNDDRVRPQHAQYASDGPYTLDRTDRIPPYGDVNCRCTITAVIE